MSHQQASLSAQLQDGPGWVDSRGVASAAGAVSGMRPQLMLVPLLPAAVHRDFALHHPGLPVAHHCPVLPGVHPGEPWDALGMAPGRGALPTVLRVMTVSSACQPDNHRQATHCCRPCGVWLFQTLWVVCAGPWSGWRYYPGGTPSIVLGHSAGCRKGRTCGRWVMVYLVWRGQGSDSRALYTIGCSN